ncbi:hypothetical protein Tco_1191443 [Tanacetum coccineum]
MSLRFMDSFQRRNPKFLNHGLSIWTLIEIFLKHLDSLSRHIINLTIEGDLRKFSDIGAWDDMVMVKVPRYMTWLDYDEHVDSLSIMDNEVGVTSPKSTTQTLPLFKEYTPPVTYPEEVEKTLGTLIKVEPLNEIKLEEVGLNSNHDTPFSSREVPSFDGPEPYPLLNSPSLNVSLGDVIGFEPPIKPYSLDSSRIKEMFDGDWGLESKEVSPLGEELSLFDRPNEVERGRILEADHLESILQQQISQRMAHSHHDGMKFLIKTGEEIFIDAGDGVRIYPDGVASLAIKTYDYIITLILSLLLSLYLMRRSLEVLRKSHWIFLGGRFSQSSYVSSQLLSKPGEY